jgi:hypothetical protein
VALDAGLIALLDFAGKLTHEDVFNRVEFELVARRDLKKMIKLA